jgi:hypothetical protein
MGNILVCFLLWATGPISSVIGPSTVPPGALSLGGVDWYTVTSAGVLGDKAGPYRLSGCVSQAPAHTLGPDDVGPFYIIGGFWSSEFSAGLDQNRAEVLATSQRPGALKLYRNSPNPFRVATRIAYDLPVRSRVLLSIYDVDGRQVARLADGWQEAGRYNLKWDGRDKRGRACPTGVYFCSLRTEDAAAVKKMLIAD